jgi:hypothetical protein
MTKPDNRGLLEDLHDAMAERFLAIARDPEASASALKEARQFLRDNNVTADASTPGGSKLHALHDELPYKDDEESVNTG